MTLVGLFRLMKKNNSGGKMDDKKHRISGAFLWGVAAVAFMVIIMITLYKYIARGRENALITSQDRLAGYNTIWAEKVGSELSSAINYGHVLGSLVKEEGLESPLTLSYMNSVVDNTSISHIIMCKDNVALFNEKNDHYANLEIPISLHDNSSEDVFTVESTPFNDGKYFAVYVAFDGVSEHCLLFIRFEDLEKDFFNNEFSDASFLAIADENGRVVGCFDSYKDLDSPFLFEENIYNLVASSTDSEKSLETLRSDFGAGNVTALTASYKGDIRTISIADTKVKGWTLIYGVRQSHVERLILSDFKTTRSAAMKLVIVLVAFCAFMILTIILNMIRSKEHGNGSEDRTDIDLLTELYNKAATERKINEYIEENPSGRALLFILDIDNFKKINDTMGHAFGDTLLKTLGKEISDEFRVSDIVGRTGGDEFMVFLKDVNDDIIVQREVSRITKFFQEFNAGGDYVKYSATASIGAAVFPDDAKTYKDLYIAADSALFRAKKRGKNQLLFYNEDTNIKSN